MKTETFKKLRKLATPKPAKTETALGRALRLAAVKTFGVR